VAPGSPLEFTPDHDRGRGRADRCTRVKRVPTIVGAVLLIGMLVWLYLYAPCGVFYWNNSKDVPARCQAELGRG
jgi:hypothetical protein